LIESDERERRGLYCPDGWASAFSHDKSLWSISRGTFPGGSTGSSVTWIAPATPTANITISVTVDDDAIIPPGDDGTRDDDPFTDEVTVHACKADLDIGSVPDSEENERRGFPAIEQ